jgi:hypothetical protein
MLAFTTSASPPEALAAQSAAAMIRRSRVRDAVPPPVEALTITAPGATPGNDALRPAIAPATQVGWSNVPLPVYANEPLALCDATTLSEDNLLASDLRYPDRTGETYAVTYNPNQRWYYFPKMEADEFVLIRCFDSAQKGAARFSAHGAFDDPNTLPDAPPRESIETRALVFF